MVTRSGVDGTPQPAESREVLAARLSAAVRATSNDRDVSR